MIDRSEPALTPEGLQFAAAYDARQPFYNSPLALSDEGLVALKLSGPESRNGQLAVGGVRYGIELAGGKLLNLPLLGDYVASRVADVVSKPVNSLLSRIAPGHVEHVHHGESHNNADYARVGAVLRSFIDNPDYRQWLLEQGDIPEGKLRFTFHQEAGDQTISDDLSVIRQFRKSAHRGLRSLRHMGRKALHNYGLVIDAASFFVAIMPGTTTINALINFATGEIVAPISTRNRHMRRHNDDATFNASLAVFMGKIADLISDTNGVSELSLLSIPRADLMNEGKIMGVIGRGNDRARAINIFRHARYLDACHMLARMAAFDPMLLRKIVTDNL